MKIANIVDLNTKKLKTRPKKALFLIIPVVVLITLSVIISSQVKNIQSALGSGVFSTISDQYTLLTVQTEQEEFNPASFFNNQSSFEQNMFSENDIANVESIDGVESASLQTTIPIRNVETSDLFTDKTVTLDNLATLDQNSAALYTTEDFTYTEGEAIPIVLSANSFTYTYEDWSNGTTISVSPPGRGEQGAEPPQPGMGMNRFSIEKQEAIEYIKDDLLGKEFTIAFGGLEDIQGYTVSRSSSGITATKLTDDEYNAEIEERKTKILEYWDYEKISTPVTYTFVIAGIDENENSNRNYIPEGFADVLMSTYINNEITARIVEEIPTSVLNADFIGITYDGEELSSGGFGGFISQIGGRFEERMGNPGGDFGGPDGGGDMPADEVSFSAISIPGLVIELDGNSVVGTLDDVDIYSTATHYSDSMNVLLTSITERSEVVKALNKAGYSYQDLGNLDVFENLESTLEKVSNVFLISFVVLVSAIVILTMGKLVSESTGEIGIFRAIGMRKKDVMVMFIFQSLLYVVIGYLIGLVLGVGLNFILSGAISVWFNSFMSETVVQTVNVTNTVDGSIFTNINWISVMTYSLLLFVISLVVSIIPSRNASQISPVEAIKNE